MNERSYRTYPEAFKLEALELLEKQEKSAGEIERELGITPGLLGKRRARYQAVQKSGHEVRLEPSDLEGPKPRCGACNAPWLRRRRYEFMAAQEGQYAVKRMCRALNASRSGYYAWRGRPGSPRAQANELLVAQIQEEFRASRHTYGSPRIHAILRRKGARCGRNRVGCLMRLCGMAARRTRRRLPRTTQRDLGAIPAPNLLRQDFAAPAPDRKWVSDITYIDRQKAGCI